MIYKEVFDLQGTEQQQQIVKEALDEIKFPFERIQFPNGTAILGWANLNSQGLQGNALMHEGDHPSKDTDSEPLDGELNGRKYIFGVFYPYSGNIYIDNALVSYPDSAKTTVSAEVAHSVDEFLPMTEAMRTEIMTLVHGGDTTEHGHTWWEKQDYSTEYFTLVGEAFMALFTYAYSDLPSEGASSFIHAGNVDMGDDIRKIIGIERTDSVEPVIDPIPQPPIEEPDQL